MDEYKETGNIAWVFLFMADKWENLYLFLVLADNSFTSFFDG